MSIRVYDTMKRAVVPLEPRDPARVSMYVCGPTVYGYIHIGNARTFICFDLIRRYLSYRGFDVTFVFNYTDVDDKVIERARVEGLPAEGVAKKYAQAFEEDMAALKFATPDVVCLATQHVPEMVAAIATLIDKGAAYEVDGDVFFAVESFDDYGKLSHRSLDEMRAGERVEPHAGKRHPLDFALWKAAKEGEPSWDSPWGRGRPGWHIECSVMSTKYLGMSFDIHGGGSDLKFPHHENEIAQAEAATGHKPFVRRWVHAGLVQMEAEKMSKSLGNVALAKDVLQAYPGEVVRYWALMSSYRSQPTFSQPVLDDAAQAYERWKTFYEAAAHVLGDDMPRVPQPIARAVGEENVQGAGGAFVKRFIDAMDDDFNSAEAFAVVHDLVTEGNRAREGAERGDAGDRTLLVELTGAFLELSHVLNLDYRFEAEDSELVGGLVEYLLELRQQARSEKAFERADAIRSRLEGLGVVVEDTPAGPRWRVAATRRGPNGERG